jgi:sulfite exporter TauE/SafE
MLLAALSAAVLAGFASIPHCAAMCGPLATYASGMGRGATLRHQLGRGIGYVVAGLIAGGTGELVSQALPARWASAILSFTLAAALAVAAWRLWRVPGTDAGLVSVGRGPRRPSWSERLFAVLPKNAFGLGALTVVLPCGALYAALLLAASSGSALGGALTMLVFAAVSGVGLSVVSAVASKLRRLIGQGVEAPFLRRVLATALMVGALLMVVRPVSQLTSERETPSCHAP